MQKSLYVALVLCAALLLFLTPASTRADSVPGDTTVVLNASMVTTLTGMGLSLSPLGQASFDATTGTLTFPITSGTIGGTGDIFKSDGSGFSLTGSSTTVTFRNLFINTSTDTLSGNVHFGNTQMNGVTLFDIGNGGALSPDAQFAATLSTALGVSNLAGTTFGTATIDVPLTSGGSTDPSGGTTPTPEPSVLGLLASSVLAIGAFAFLRHRKTNPSFLSGAVKHEA
jgi:hypothetical protein